MMTTPMTAQTRDDAQQILMILLNAPSLTQYYHFQQRPDRLPLKLTVPPGVDVNAAGLQAAGEAVVLVDTPDERTLAIDVLNVANDRAQVMFTFRVEGVVGRAELSRASTGWSISRLSVAER